MRILIALFSICTFFINAQTFNDFTGVSGEIRYVNTNENTGISLMGGDENYVSFNQGVSWVEFDNSVGTSIFGLVGLDGVVISSNVFCMIMHNPNTNSFSIVRSSNAGVNWIVINTFSGPSQELRAIQSNGNNVVVTAINGIYYSLDAGLNWSFVALSGAGEISNFVDYNTGSNSWFVGGYADDLLVSVDQGVSWSNSGLMSASIDVIRSSNLYNQLLLVKDSPSGAELITIDSGNNISSIGNVPNSILFTSFDLMDANYLPSGFILASNTHKYYMIDTAGYNVYHIDYPTAASPANNFIGLNSTYGVAAMWRSSFNSQTAYLIDYNQLAEVYVPSYFDIYNESTTCAGDDIVAIPRADYYDSLKWYVNNVFISDNSVLTYPTPQVIASYSIQLKTYYNGEEHSTTKTKTFSAQQSPHTYTYSIDTIACYDQPHLVFINPDNGAQNTSVLVKYDGQVVAGPQAMTYLNMSLYTSPITTEDTLEVITFNTLPCDSSADTLFIPLTLGPDMSGFSLLPHDSNVCIGDSIYFELIDTESIYEYSMNTTYSVGIGVTNDSQEQQGVGVDTMNFVTLGQNNWHNNSTYQELYVPYISMFTEFIVHDNSTGCYSPPLMDTIDSYRTKAYYELHSRSFYKDDTVHLTNAFVTDSILWSSNNYSGIILNENAPSPLMIADSTGFFNLKLKNEPLPGCSESITKVIHIANPSPALSSLCDTSNSIGVLYLHKTKIDQFGNRYELGSNGDGNFDIYPAYSLRKYDSNGTLIWEKSADIIGSTSVQGAVIEDFEFDSQGDLISVGWITANNSFTDEYLSMTPSSNQYDQWSLVFKIDKNNGDLVWRKRINDFIGQSLQPGTHFKVTDLIVDKNNGDIHISTYYQWDLDFITLDFNGDLINHSELDLGGWSQDKFIYASFHVAAGGQAFNARQSYWSPQLEMLSTGEVIAIGYYKNASLPNYPELDLGDSNYGMFILKYHPSNGIYDFEILADLGNFDWYSATQPGPLFYINDNDDITVATTYQNGNYPGEFSFLDSSFVLNSGSSLAQFDVDYNLNWFSLGTHCSLMDMKVSEATGDYFLLGKSVDNFSFGQIETHIMAGEDISKEFNYTSFPNLTGYPSLDHQTFDFFLARFDKEGIPKEIKMLDDTVALNYNLGAKMAVSPCGEVTISVNNPNDNSSVNLLFEGQSFNVDSITTFNLSDNCMGECSYFDAPDTINTCSVGVTDIQLSTYYNVDSVHYNLIENGTILYDSITPLINGVLELELPAYSEYLIVFSQPNIDSLIVVNSPLTPVSFDFIDSICYGELVNIEASDTSFSYNWLGGNLTGVNTYLDTSYYSNGLNSINVIITDGNCSQVDTVNFFINSYSDDVVYTFQDSLCYGSLIELTVSDTTFIYSWLNSGYSGTQIEIDSVNYDYGLNLIDVIVDNGVCPYYDTVVLYVDSFIPAIVYTFDDSLCNGSSVNLSASDSSYTYNWLNGILSGQEITVSPSDYVIGNNYIDLTVNSGGCSFDDTVFLFIEEFEPLVDISFIDSLCFGELININASDSNYNYSWLGGSYIGTNITLDSSEYNIGNNTFEVVISDSVCQAIENINVYIDGCLSQSELDSYFTISPNPSTGKFSIEFNSELSELDVMIYSEDGKLILNNSFVGDTTAEFDLKVAQGVYFIVVESMDNSSVHRLVIK